MNNLSNDQLNELRSHLQGAVIACTERGLYQSSKWAAELLNSLPTETLDAGSDTDPDSPIENNPKHSRKQPPIPPVEDAVEAQLEAQEYHKFLLAKSFFDCREYDRCAAAFLPSTKPRVPSTPTGKQSTSFKKSASTKGKEKIFSSPPSVVHADDNSLSEVSQKALFLAIYAKYLAGEKRKDEESEMILGPADGGVTINKEIVTLIAILGDWLRRRHAKKLNGGGWLEYMYGILLAKNKNEEQAKDWLLKSVHLCPFNWGAWQELSNLLNNTEEVQKLDEMVRLVPKNIVAFMFAIYTSQELGQATEQVNAAIDQVEVYFPNSPFLKSQRALLYYHAKEFEESSSIFAQLLLSDPYRLDAMDQYSNVLYVLDHRPRLAFLAQLAAQIDKFRPETCCIVGNYYSRNSEHEKAVMYFRRALTLDRNFLSAWTLMGHEYVEMRNTHAALESYRRAVDVNRKDYRAWHGLGLTYEMLEMHSYALFYHQRAAALRPFDAKTWQAVGACFARVGKTQNAIRAYKRALVAGSYYLENQSNNSFGDEGISALSGGVLDPESLYQLAVLYERTGEMNECAAYMELVIAQEEAHPGVSNVANATFDEDLNGLMSSQMSGHPGAGVGDGPKKSPGQGVGVTATTSRARMWLAKWEFMNQNYQRASELANELCQDGVEVEEAKALVRDIRARVERERQERLRND